MPMFNKVLASAIIAWFAAQLLKVLIEWAKIKKFDIKRFMTGSGGMPSSHSASVCAMAAAVGQICGLNSPEFGIAAISAVIVMYDASGVRRAAGEQAKLLNYIIENWQNADDKLMDEKLKELIGHTPIQVFAGALLGILVGLLICM